MANLSWSYSSLKDFKNCARKFHEVRVLRKYPREETDATRYGTALHLAAEEYIRDSKALPPEFSFMQPTLDALNALPGRKLCEHKMGVTQAGEPCDFFAPDVWSRGVADLLIINDDNFTASVFDYKGLPLDTKLPTPGGYVTMRDIKVGDFVFGSDGRPCSVTFKSEVHHKPCLEVLFDDGARVTCDEDHRWALSDGTDTEAKFLRPGAKIPVAAPLKTASVDLPVDPYVFGLWLADGKHTSGEITKPDAFVWEEIERRGFTLGKMSPPGVCRVQTVLGLHASIKRLGAHGNKHIPPLYMRASEAQRLDLLRGIMDGDGYANAKRQQAVLNTTNAEYAQQVAELASTLGNKVYVANTTAQGFGTTVPAYQVTFKATVHNPFLMPRKAVVLGPTTVRSRSRRVRSVLPVPYVPTQCIGVDSPDHTYLCTERCVVTHNSGSDKYPDPDQLKLMALMVFAHFRHIRVVKGGLLFVLKGTVTRMRLEVENADASWWYFRNDVAKLEKAHETGVWNPTQSGLCRKHCPVRTCEFNGLR